MARSTIIDNLMSEVIYYGGLPMRRADVYQAALEATGSHKAADMFAFSPNHKEAPAGTEPLSEYDIRRIIHAPSESEKDDWERGKEIFIALTKQVEKPARAVKHLSDNDLSDVHTYKISQLLMGNDKTIGKAVIGEWVRREPQRATAYNERAQEEENRASSPTKIAVRKDGNKWNVYNPDHKHYGEVLASFDDERLADAHAEALESESSRSLLSQSSDERQEHSLTLDPDDPKVEIWKRDPGRADVKGIDTPHRTKKTLRKRKPSKTDTTVRGLRR